MSATAQKTAAVPVLIDTSLWIEALRQGGSRTATNAVFDALDTGIALINGVIRTEVLRGAADSDRARLSDLIDAVVTVPFARSTFDHAAEFGAELQARGATIPTVDLLIAASALEHDAVLWHRDRHFCLAGNSSDLRETFVS